jgi:hypothetical protein
MDPESFAIFLPVRPGGGDTPDGQKVHVLFRALRCGESDEDKEALNFTTKIYAEGVRIELGSKDSPDTPASMLSSNPRKRKYEKGVRSASDEEVILQVMHKVAESMAHEGNPVRGTSKKRYRLGEHRKPETENLMKLLSQKRELRESGLLREDPEIMEELEVEIKCCRSRGLHYFRKEEKDLM